MVEYKVFHDKDAYKIENCWEEIGIQLEISETELKDIRYAERRYGHSDTAFRDMLRVWLKQKNPSPTWSSFAEALERVKFQEFADYLRSKYCMCTFRMYSSMWG